MNLLIVVPCYNEEEMLPETTRQLTAVIKRMEEDKSISSGRILYVDDGSRDRTWSLIEQYASENSKVCGLKLSRNSGHQFALTAGLEWAADNADAAISIDADLQDDVNAIFDMVKSFNNGADIVYGVRRERKTDTFFKRNTALMFYRLMNRLGGKIIYNHADFRLMSRRALKSLMEYPERNLFLRGMVASLGYPSDIVYYDRRERMAGVSKYPLKKMISFALDGITSFSIKPLHYITYLGFVFILISIAVIIYALVSYFDEEAIQGWTSLLISVWFIGGCILIACGVTGEYIGKIYIETKRRPLYFIEKRVGMSKQDCKLQNK
ncbi:glycosyltransferase family 2 protein [uncultured Prevotella sp.]|uniref:glycosyltransferase family 2 protein n=1 Tax=uncultured Prevotella sp. TaxID=159272 RepID=UPI0025F79B1F|nr:glycosyltransferase family 2 protein [uncultured Prevotella sp.]